MFDIYGSLISSAMWGYNSSYPELLTREIERAAEKQQRIAKEEEAREKLLKKEKIKIALDETPLYEVLRGITEEYLDNDVNIVAEDMANTGCHCIIS